MAKKEVLVASIRPRPSSTQVMVTDMTTRVGKHPNLASRQAKENQFGSSRGGRRRVGRFRVAETKTENGTPKRITENGKSITANRKKAKRKTENGTPKTEPKKKKTENRYRKVESGKRNTVMSQKADYVSSSCLTSNIGHGIVLIASAVYGRSTTVIRVLYSRRKKQPDKTAMNRTEPGRNKAESSEEISLKMLVAPLLSI